MNAMLRHSLLATAVLMCICTPSYCQGVNAKDNNGWTALMFAAYGGQADRVKALIAAGADVNAKDNWRETALIKAVFVARMEKYCIMVPPSLGAQVGLVTYNPCQINTRRLNAGAGNVDCVKALIAAGADLNAKDRDGMTALIESAAQDNVDCVKALIAAGADVNAKARHGKTALKLAKSSGVADLLLAAGAKK